MTSRSNSGMSGPLTPRFPVARTAPPVGYRQNLNLGAMFSVENYEGESVQDEFAYVGRMLGPASRSARDPLDGSAKLLRELGSHQFAALQVPLESSQGFPACFFVELNLFPSHAGAAWTSALEPRPRGSSWP